MRVTDRQRRSDGASYELDRLVVASDEDVGGHVGRLRWLTPLQLAPHGEPKETCADEAVRLGDDEHQGQRPDLEIERRGPPPGQVDEAETYGADDQHTYQRPAGTTRQVT